ncbi:hypothetical protein PAPYR_11309 [Paratrimastix pyriformis]|uniref:HTH La-type RNA-binding domain-containing protein n=1 Tax=Paratrimastix pyriformis TaxID=342808 RepID=A0ABQ8U408_9EUKA|nr:hypothetical protein PAPYR_11309 [Paratrimastix pyriformis]
MDNAPECEKPWFDAQHEDVAMGDDEAKPELRRQLEHYFSDSNLPTDTYFKQLIHQYKALTYSTFLELSPDRTGIRRRGPLPDYIVGVKMEELLDEQGVGEEPWTEEDERIEQAWSMNPATSPSLADGPEDDAVAVTPGEIDAAAPPDGSVAPTTPSDDTAVAPTPSEPTNPTTSSVSAAAAAAAAAATTTTTTTTTPSGVDAAIAIPPPPPRPPLRLPRGYVALTANGGVLKRVLRAAPAAASARPCPTEPNIVDVAFFSFLTSTGEYVELPPHLLKPPRALRFVVGDLPRRALDIAVQSMHVGERAIVRAAQPYTYLGCCTEIPGPKRRSAVCSFVVELKKCIPKQFEQRPSVFADRLRYAALEKEAGNIFLEERAAGKAVAAYNKALSAFQSLDPTLVAPPARQAWYDLAKTIHTNAAVVMVQDGLFGNQPHNPDVRRGNVARCWRRVEALGARQTAVLGSHLTHVLTDQQELVVLTTENKSREKGDESHDITSFTQSPISLERVDRLRNAVKHCTEALKMDPRWAKALLKRAQARRLLEDFDEVRTDETAHVMTKDT